LLNTMIDLCAALIGNCGCQEWLPPVFAMGTVRNFSSLAC